MGIKGSKQTNEADLTANLLLERLNQISGLTSKKMFGGFGIFHEGKMFALVNSQGEVYLKTDESIHAKFEEADSKQHARMPYFSLPERVLDNIDDLISWSKESIEISK